MHTITELGTSVPAFLGKLWKLVEDPETDDLICWSPNGRSFFIRNQAQFARELLPHYYKHNNMASFVRQLNMYGFHKKVSVDLGGLKCDKDEMEFAHQYFCKGHPYLLEHIKRKIASNKGQDSGHPPIKPELMNKMLTEVRSMRGRQEQLDSRLGAMKRENEALWRELAMLRQKHLKQQQIVNKLIHFLVSLVQPSRSGGLSVKRRYPLMIDDTRRQHKQPNKLTKVQASPKGPVIHELDASDHDMDSQYIVGDILESHEDPTIESPEHNAAILDEEGNPESVHYVEDTMPTSAEVNFVIQNQQGSDPKKKRVKGKKKRKNTVPIKILIPATKCGEEPREETLMLEVSAKDNSLPVSILQNEATSSKPVPIATVRSSKLAAMAANMNKSANESEIDIELESAAEVLEEESKEDTNLDSILIIPEVISEHNYDNEENGNCEIAGPTSEDDGEQSANLSLSNEITPIDTPASTNGSQLKSSTENQEAGTSSSTDLSLSCFSSPGLSDSVCRLGSSMEEVDNHVETMQTELENVRDMLLSEGCTFDANTLLSLFGVEDPMSYGIPVNPDLASHSFLEKEDEHPSESTNSGGGKLIAYNSTPNLLDFDDDIFLGVNPSSPISADTEFNANSDFNTDSIDIEDNKASILNSLISNNINSSNP